MREENFDNMQNDEECGENVEDNFVDVAPAPAPVGGTCECDFDVDYCCVESVPSFYNNNLSTRADDNRIFYDPTCLSCAVETCTVQIPCSTGGTSTATLYAAVIKGCMPFQAEARFNNPAPCNQPPFTNTPPRNAAICCRGTVCFDNAVAFGCPEDMEDLCACINDLLSNPTDACQLIVNTPEPIELIRCMDFKRITPSTAGRCTDRFVRFQGTFTISPSFLQQECMFQRY